MSQNPGHTTHLRDNRQFTVTFVSFYDRGLVRIKFRARRELAINQIGLEMTLLYTRPHALP